MTKNPPVAPHADTHRRHGRRPTPAPPGTGQPAMARLVLLTVLMLGVLGLIAVVVFILTSRPTGSGGDALVVRDDSHVLNQAVDEKAVLVEFVDIECQVCGYYYPAIEQLKDQHRDELTLVIRHFPLSSHANSTNAAVALEAAAAQGQLELMYQRLFETQATWGGAQQSQAGIFRSFAEDLGLDMERYDAAVAAPATVERVQSDFDDGRALGVQGTPTFFLNGQRLETQSPDHLARAVGAALGQ